jgi:hypothetical protein
VVKVVGSIPIRRHNSQVNSAMNLWKPEHTHVFLCLKVILTSEPILKGTKLDGTPFIVTMDGCKVELAGMCSQRFTTINPKGKEVTRIHPIAFTLKRTLPTEEKYKLFLLEFTALKFSLDKLSDFMCGFPVELETDCRALRDHLTNEKLNMTHSQWHNGVLDHDSIDV